MPSGVTKEVVAQMMRDPVEMAGRIAELEYALRPFANFYTPAMELAGDGHVITQGSSLARRQLTVGDVRQAYKSLSKS